MHWTNKAPVKKETKAEIPLNIASSASGDEGPEVAQRVTRVAAANASRELQKLTKAEIPLNTASNANGDEGPEVAQRVRRVTVANTSGELQKLTKAPMLSTTVPSSLSTSEIPLRKSLSDHSTHKASALTCVCNGAFNEGDRVKYMGHAYPPGRTFGTVLGGTDNGFLNVEWDSWSAGHDGHCKFTTCGSCSVSSVTSRWFTACNDVDVER